MARPSTTNNQETTLPLATILHLLTIKLSSSNFLLWRNQMLPLLSSQNLLGYVDDSMKPPTISIPYADEAMAEVLGLQTARDVWLALEAAYSHDSVERMHTLKDSLRALTKGNSTVAEFGRKFKAICDQLAAIGRPVDGDDKTHWFLCGLGASFENFSTAIMAKASLYKLYL
ncbi:putative RNA-directed DNA polymerase [Tanacetum coccineum]